MSQDIPFEKLPKGIQYYMLDWKDRNMKKVRDEFNTTRLRDFNQGELYLLYGMIVEADSVWLLGENPNM